MLTSTIIRQSLVRQNDRLAMYDLHSSYFCNLNKHAFFNDMSKKDWIIILRDGNNIICGFSTIEIIHTKFNTHDPVSSNNHSCCCSCKENASTRSGRIIIFPPLFFKNKDNYL